VKAGLVITRYELGNMVGNLSNDAISLTCDKVSSGNYFPVEWGTVCISTYRGLNNI
jgi:hypothetical protein